MENRKLSAEEKADLALESLNGITALEIPDGFEQRMLARFEKESVQSVKPSIPKFFWAAAVLLLAINVTAVVKYSVATDSSSTNSISNNNQTAKQNSSPQEQVANYYFNGGTSWY